MPDVPPDTSLIPPPQGEFVPDQEAADLPPIDTQPAPVLGQERIVSIDVLRGFALLGILVMNIQSFSMVSQAYMNPNAYGDLTGINWWVWACCNVLADQKFFTIFSMLFGAGIVIFSSRAEAGGRRPAGLHYRRMGWLILFGLLHAHLLWYGDILYFYGMCGLVAYPFRKLPAAALVPIGLFFIVIGSSVNVLMGLTIPMWPEESFTQFVDDSWLPNAETITAELNAYRGNWLEQAPYRNIGAFFFETFAFFFFVGWKVLGLMLIGMSLYKWRIFSALKSYTFYVGMLLICAVIGLSLVIFGLMEHNRHEWAAEYSFFFGLQYNYWGSLFVSLAYVAMIMLICKSGVLTILRKSLAAVGQMAFTNYIMQTVICTTIFYGHGFGQYGYFDRWQQILVVFGVWIVQMIISPIWLSAFRFGPLEWLWRCLSYWRIQPIRKQLM